MSNDALGWLLGVPSSWLTQPPKQPARHRADCEDDAAVARDDDDREVLHIAAQAVPSDAPAKDAAVVVEVRHAALARPAVVWLRLGTLAQHRPEEAARARFPRVGIRPPH